MMNTDYSHYTDFLKDNKFIRWQLMPSEASEAYWEKFIRQYPQHKKKIDEAIAYLKTNGLNKSILSNEESTLIFEKIQQTIRHHAKRAKIRQLIRYSAAACVAVVLTIIGIHLFSPERENGVPHQKGLIVGNMLDSKEIQFITGKESITFKKNVEVRLDKHGNAKIIQEDNQKKTVQTAPNKLNRLIVPYGKRTQLCLSDGSKVWLNSGSILEFPAQFSDNKRQLLLASGEMYIEVMPDKQRPFFVDVNKFNVEVLGTKFNVAAYPDLPNSVVLVEGSVMLKSDDNSEIQLSSNEMAQYNSSGNFSKEAVDVSPFISWIYGYLVFDKTPISEVLTQVSRYYNLSFNFENDINLKKRTCTGKLYLSDKLDDVMSTIAVLSSTRYKRKNKTIYISTKK